MKVVTDRRGVAASAQRIVERLTDLLIENRQPAMLFLESGMQVYLRQRYQIRVGNSYHGEAYLTVHDIRFVDLRLPDSTEAVFRECPPAIC